VRAGLDYHEYAELRRARLWEAFLNACAPDRAERCFAFTTRGTRGFARRGLAGRATGWCSAREAPACRRPARTHRAGAQRVRLPMRAGQRSLNLSNAVAVAVFEAWRQCGYAGAAAPALTPATPA
jgi:tRNA (cytidine/uridine-2'-O-)-methyltransferase